MRLLSTLSPFQKMWLSTLPSFLISDQCSSTLLPFYSTWSRIVYIFVVPQLVFIQWVSINRFIVHILHRATSCDFWRCTLSSFRSPCSYYECQLTHWSFIFFTVPHHVTFDDVHFRRSTVRGCTMLSTYSSFIFFIVPHHVTYNCLHFQRFTSCDLSLSACSLFHITWPMVVYTFSFPLHVTYHCVHIQRRSPSCDSW